MPAPEPQQPRRGLSPLHQPVLDAVVFGAAHQQRLARKKVQGQQLRIMCTPDDGVEAPLLQVPQRDRPSAATSSQQRDPRTCEQTGSGVAGKGS